MGVYFSFNQMAMLWMDGFLSKLNTFCLLSIPSIF